MMICKYCQVYGRVQGVSYRLATRKKATELGVTGYVQNMNDGSVEVLACGDAADVDRLCSWLSSGPILAQVSHVQCEGRAFTKSDEFIIC